MSVWKGDININDLDASLVLKDVFFTGRLTVGVNAHVKLDGVSWPKEIYNDDENVAMNCVQRVQRLLPLDEGGPPADNIEVLPPGARMPLCPQGAGEATSTAVEQFTALCTQAELATCAPVCEAETHGYRLLAQIDGLETTMECSQHFGLYSWVGQASNGGYIGPDFVSFFSAVASGAMGSYAVTLSEDSQISTDLTIRVGQDAVIGAESGLDHSPSIGIDFTVQEHALLHLAGVGLSGRVTLAASPNPRCWAQPRVVLDAVFYAADRDGVALSTTAEGNADGTFSLTPRLPGSAMGLFTGTFDGGR